MTDSKGSSYIRKNSNCAVIVAHPNDETLWAGGLMLMHPQAHKTLKTLLPSNKFDLIITMHSSKLTY